MLSNDKYHMETLTPKSKHNPEPTADKFFDNIDYISIIDTVKGIFTSDGSIATLLDFERVLDSADLYAYKNWELGELVQGPDVKKYTVACTFLFPQHLMPNPRGAKRLLLLGGVLKFKKTKIKVPVQVEDYDDYIPGTRYPKTMNRVVWLVYVQLPKKLISGVKQGSIDLSGQSIDLADLEDAYDKDLDTTDGNEKEESAAEAAAMGGLGGLGGLPPMGGPPMGGMPPGPGGI
jgi:hypothetical protein